MAEEMADRNGAVDCEALGVCSPADFSVSADLTSLFCEL